MNTSRGVDVDGREIYTSVNFYIILNQQENKMKIFIFIVMVILLLILERAFIKVDHTPTGGIIVNKEIYDLNNISKNLSKYDQSKERYLRQTYVLSQALAKGNEVEHINTGVSKLGNFSAAIYTGSIIVEAMKWNQFLTTGASLTTKVYDSKIVEEEINNILVLHRKLIIKSRNYNENSTLQETEEYLGVVGEFGGKTMYFALRSDAKAMASFFDGVLKVLQKTGFYREEKIKEFCKGPCYEVFQSLKNNGFEILTTTSPKFDYSVYESFGAIGKISAPIFLKGTSFGENEIKNTIIPAAKEFQRNIISSINASQS